MSEIDDDIKINVWINEERLEALKKAGAAGMAKDVFAGMMLLAISTTDEQKDVILQRYPSANYSRATRSIELLPKQAKDRLFDLAVEMRSTGSGVIDRFLEES